MAACFDHEGEVKRHVAEVKLRVGKRVRRRVGGLVNVDLDQFRRRRDVDAPPGVVKLIRINALAPLELLYVGDVWEILPGAGTDADASDPGQRLRSEIDRQVLGNGRQIKRVGALVGLFHQRHAR